MVLRSELMNIGGVYYRPEDVQAVLNIRIKPVPEEEIEEE